MAQKSCLITQKCASQLVHFLLEPFPCHHGLNEKHTSCITEYIFQSKHNDLRAFAYIFSRLKPYYNITGILRSSCMRSSGFKRMFITWIRAVASARSGKVELKISWKCFLRRRRSWICGRNVEGLRVCSGDERSMNDAPRVFPIKTSCFFSALFDYDRRRRMSLFGYCMTSSGQFNHSHIHMWRPILIGSLIALGKIGNKLPIHPWILYPGILLVFMSHVIFIHINTLCFFFFPRKNSNKQLENKLVL